LAPVRLLPQLLDDLVDVGHLTCEPRQRGQVRVLGQGARGAGEGG
jgi:hypothetical protein